MIEMIVSGGQTGADQGGLRAASKFGIKTGGFIPAGCRTENGPNRILKDLYNLKETSSSSYPPRTELNVQMSDLTLIFGNSSSSGSKLTEEFCKKHKKPYDFVSHFDAVDMESVLDLIESVKQETGKDKLVVNIAGNRESVNKGIGKKTEMFVSKMLDNVNAA